MNFQKTLCKHKLSSHSIISFFKNVSKLTLKSALMKQTNLFTMRLPCIAVDVKLCFVSVWKYIFLVNGCLLKFCRLCDRRWPVYPSWHVFLEYYSWGIATNIEKLWDIFMFFFGQRFCCILCPKIYSILVLHRK